MPSELAPSKIPIFSPMSINLQTPWQLPDYVTNCSPQASAMPIKAHGFLSLPHSLKPLLVSTEARSLPIPLLRHHNQRILTRYYASDASSPSRCTHNIAVVGGGITGLATAYYLSKKQDVNVTLYEVSDRLGGWIQTKQVDVPGGKVLFEQGPRTLRPSLPNGILAAGLVFPSFPSLPPHAQ